MTAGSRALLQSLSEAIDLLSEYTIDSSVQHPIAPLPSLLDECESLLSSSFSAEPVRTIHHFACTGGTVISKCIASLPNTILLSEIDPLSRMYFLTPRASSFVLGNKDHAFRPTDFLMALRTSVRPVPETTLIHAFTAGITALVADLAKRGLTTVIRDHPHSQFCTEVDPDDRATVREMLMSSLPTLSVVTTRHPLDSFLAVDANGWRSFQPFTLNEYARRYSLFLDRHDGVPIVRYEDFVTSAEKALKQLAEHLKLGYSPFAAEVFPIVMISGDSGRASDRIGLRSRRLVPENVLTQIETANEYISLCERLGYEPHADAR